MRSSRGKLSAYHKNRPFLGSVLKQAADILRRMSTNHVNSDSLAFVKKSEGLIRLLEELEDKPQTPIQLDELLRGVVDEIHRLVKIVNLSRALSVISNRDMDPNAREGLVICTKKLARYREAARFLFRVAKKVKVFQKVKIVPIHLGHTTFHSPSESHQTPPTLKSALLRIFEGQEPLLKAQLVCRILKKTEQNIDQDLSETFIRTRDESKIHAEVQLALHYELSPVPCPPRIIASNKDACYLCNTFIHYHGKYLIPRSHGRLYHAWKLPTWPTKPDIAVGFNRVLDDRIRQSILAMASRNRRILYPHPIESNISSLALSDSTV
jgi:hypothetical protein